MKSIFEIKNQETIKEVLNFVEFGTLAICKDDKPYSLPVNFVYLDNHIYFHGSLKGRKIDVLKKNQLASFSVVEPYSVIQSYFSLTDNLACPATHFFKSVMIDGRVEFVKNYEEKVQALSALMQKLQKEGRYKPLGEEVYRKMINATTVCKIIIDSISGKFKFGQHLSQERFDMIIEHLEKRGNKKDINTIKLMEKFKKD